MERLFDTFLPDLLGGSEAPARAGAWGFSPGLDVEENDKEVIVSVDLPGVDEDDIDVRLEGDLLTVSGEKREEHEHSDRGWSHVERSYGRFQRSVALDTEVKAEEARASFRKGVLRITLPKSENQKRRGTAIPVKAG
jgi:HSP20 family protein